MLSGLVDAIYWLIASWFGWQRNPQEGAALQLPPEGDTSPVEEYLPTEDVMAYLLEDDPSIYVGKGAEEEVAGYLNAKVDGDRWQFSDDGVTVKKERKEIVRPLAGSTVAIARNVIWDGFKCVTLQMASAL